MKKALIGIGILLFLTSVPLYATGFWDTYVIRQGGGVSPVINESSGIYEFIIREGGQKAGLGTNDIAGLTVGDISTISIIRVDDYTRFTPGSGPAVGPYINIWITNGFGKFAVIANEPSNDEWKPGNQQWDMDWDTLKTKTVKVFETDDKSWLPNNGVGLKFEDVAGFIMQAPTAAEFATPWSGLGTGAPREYNTNNAYAFNWVFGDTLNNYVSGADGYIVSNPVITSRVASTPEPSIMLLFSLGFAGLAGFRRYLNR